MRLFAVVNGRVIDDLGDGTSPTYTRIHYLLRGLKDLGVHIDSISFDLREGKGVSDIIYNNALKTLVALRTASRLVRQRPLVYFAYPHSMTTFQNRLLFKFCRHIGLKTVLDIHDTVEQAGALGARRSGVDDEFEGYCFRNASLALALNSPMWNHIRETHNVPKDVDVAFVPNAFEEEICDMYQPYRSLKGRFNICYMGGITRNRGIELLIRACQILRERHPEIRLYIYGSYSEGCPQEMRDLMEDEEFIIQRTLPRRDLLRALQDIDLFVMPYNPGESYMNLSSPTKLYEYIGMTRPIICTRCESLHDLDGTGIIFIDYDARDMAEKIEGLMEDPARREDISRRLLQVRGEHTWRNRASRALSAMSAL